jgi:cation transport regulator ChaB
MPYTNSNPPAAISKLPAAAQHIWIAAFNAAYKQHKDNEARCFQIAWAAVQNAGYYKAGDGSWKLRK